MPASSSRSARWGGPPQTQGRLQSMAAKSKAARWGLSTHLLHPETQLQAVLAWRSGARVLLSVTPKAATGGRQQQRPRQWPRQAGSKASSTAGGPGSPCRNSRYPSPLSSFLLRCTCCEGERGGQAGITARCAPANCGCGVGIPAHPAAAPIAALGCVRRLGAPPAPTSSRKKTSIVPGTLPAAKTGSDV